MPRCSARSIDSEHLLRWRHTGLRDSWRSDRGTDTRHPNCDWAIEVWATSIRVIFQEVAVIALADKRAAKTGEEAAVTITSFKVARVRGDPKGPRTNER